MSLSGGDYNTEIISIIWNYRQWLKHLQICETEENKDISGQVQRLWGTMSLGSLLSLEMLAIHGLGSGTDWRGFSLGRILELL